MAAATPSARLADGERVQVSSRRGSVEAPVRFDLSPRPGLALFTPHFSEEVDVDLLTNEAWDPKSGTSEFKATAVRIEKLPERPAGLVAGRRQSDLVCDVAG